MRGFPPLQRSKATSVAELLAVRQLKQPVLGWTLQSAFYWMAVSETKFLRRN